MRLRRSLPGGATKRTAYRFGTKAVAFSASRDSAPCSARTTLNRALRPRLRRFSRSAQTNKVCRCATPPHHHQQVTWCLHGERELQARFLSSVSSQRIASGGGAGARRWGPSLGVFAPLLTAPGGMPPTPSLRRHGLVVAHVHLGVRAHGGMAGDRAAVGADVSVARAGEAGATVSAMVPVGGQVVVGAREDMAPGCCSSSGLRLQSVLRITGRRSGLGRNGKGGCMCGAVVLSTKTATLNTRRAHRSARFLRREIERVGAAGALALRHHRGEAKQTKGDNREHV